MIRTRTISTKMIGTRTTDTKFLIGGKSCWWILAVALGLASLACDSSKNAAQDEKDKPQAQTPAITPADTPLPTLSLPVDSGPMPVFKAERAMQYVKEIVALGPRPIGSANHKKLEDYITSHLKGDVVEDDAFTADMLEGKFPVRNIIAKFPGTKDGVIVIASHYDTNYPLRNTSFIGANDGAATSALLLEFANQLRGKQREGYSVWLLWTDAEEAMKTWSDTDSVYGTRHLAQKWKQDGTAKQIKAFLLADMIGDADLDIDRDTHSTPWLESVVYEAATRAGYQSHFFARTNTIEDDHLPFMNIGVPCADIIDINYGYNNVFHHTVQDTVDKLSTKSLDISGTVILETVRILDKMDPLPPK
jgi:glutaminyl-peptide cyclotransferase